MYYEDLIDNTFDDESSVALKLKQKDATYALKKMDKQYEKFTIPFYDTWTDGKYYKRILVENYGSGPAGSFIRNAATGLRYDIRVGTIDEGILFKVTNSSGFNKRKEPLILYYDSPEEYEKHYFTHVSDDVKEKWLEKCYSLKKH